MDRLRSPGGCPWDAEQTHESLVEYLIEEAYEVVEAIESNNQDAMKEELGDLLLQVVFHARIAQPQWNVDDVISGITNKLIERHPHVFADSVADSPAEVEEAWHVRKAREKGRTSLTEGIPEALPALMRASKLQSRTKSLSVQPSELANQANEILGDIQTSDQFGELLFELVRAARERGWDAEASLRGAVRDRIAELRKHELGD